MSGSSSHSRRWISSRLSGVLRKSCRLTIRLVLPNRGIDAGDVLLQIDVLHALGNRRPQQHQPLLLGAGVLAAVAPRGGR